MDLALIWRCDGSEGVRWHIRAIRGDGSFYGEIQFMSADPSRRVGAAVSGQLNPVDCKRMIPLLGAVCRQSPPAAIGQHFAVLFERLSVTNAGDVRRLFEYDLGDEARSGPARAFVELASLMER